MLADALEQDLIRWARSHSVIGSVCAFETIQDARSPNSWAGLKHIYGSQQARKHWTKWRCARILVSRIQEGVWRRSWPLIVSPTRPAPQPQHFATVRQQIVEEISVAAASEFGSDDSQEPQRGSVANGLITIIALTLAGTCLIEQLSEPATGSDGGRVVHINQPLHLDPFDQTSTHLAWLIGRVDYVAEKVGVRWASTVGSFLKGQTSVYYDLSRS